MSGTTGIRSRPPGFPRTQEHVEVDGGTVGAVLFQCAGMLMGVDLFFDRYSSRDSRIVVGIVILLLLCRLMAVGDILIFENLEVGTLPTPPN